MARPKRSAEAFTVGFPSPLPAEPDGEAWRLEVDGQALRLTNLDKVFWPDEGYTKGDLIAYYWNAADLILPHLQERPLTMKRMPDGIAGEAFYEKHAPSHTPDWMPRCLVPSDEARGGSIEYLMANDRASLLFMANLGCIEFHPLHSRCGQIERPDYLFFDLDPFEPYTYEDVLAVARLVHISLEQLELTGYPKTSGATGMQIFAPIEPRYSYDQIRELVRRVGQAILAADPERVTMASRIADRDGHIYIDHAMNRSGANIAAVYSLRPEPGATASTPLTWEEVEAGGITPADFRIDNAFERWAATGDLFAGVRDAPQSIDAVLEALEVSAPAPPALPTSSSDVVAASKDPDLGRYVELRDFDATPEPSGSEPIESQGDSFVIHKHRATRLHYDVRLEHDGALPSWAVPKGLPIVKGDKRLAVRTENHPLEYGKFEGTIPEGHYGAGEIRIFDNGTYEVVEWNEDKVSFILHGRRYPGMEFHFVRTKLGAPGENNWLALLATKQQTPPIREPSAFSPMLAEGGWEAFDDPQWRFEPKLDGFRCLASMSTAETRLTSRTGRNMTDTFPELHMIHEMVNQVNAVLDGELVAFDENGRNSFEALQRRAHMTGEKAIIRATKSNPVAFVAFDLLWLDGHDTTGLPLEQRRELLETIVEEDHRIQLSVYVDGDGVAFTEQALELGLEGVMAKRLGSTYRSGERSSDWRKIKLTTTQDCVILGWTPGKGGRGSTFGSLLVGAWIGDELRWIGQVGTGFTDETLDMLLEKLESIEVDEAQGDDPDLPHVVGARYCQPILVCEVEYLELTDRTGKMRGPSFKGLRDDVSPEDCILERQ